jgi:hypothetical protein
VDQFAPAIPILQVSSRAVEDLRPPWPVILLRELAARPGSLRRFQADSGAGSARDAEEAGGRYVKDIYDLQGFYGSDRTRTATSGVTGRHGATGYDRLRPGIIGYSRAFLVEPTGCDRLRPATTRHSLCGSCVVDLMSTPTTARRSASMSSTVDLLLTAEASSCGLSVARKRWLPDWRVEGESRRPAQPGRR